LGHLAVWVFEETQIPRQQDDQTIKCGARERVACVVPGLEAAWLGAWKPYDPQFEFVATGNRERLPAPLIGPVIPE